jgi:hypothetical protein
MVAVSTDTAHPGILPIEALILNRCKLLALSRSDLVRRAGFKNVAKGLRRLEELFAGELMTTASLVAGLPLALELPTDVVADTMRQTVQQIEEATRLAEEELAAAWRASFQPSAYLLGTEMRPSQITLYGMTGGSERWFKIPLDLTQPAATFAGQALAVARETPVTQFFGATTGFVVNYSPDCAVQFDLNGHPVETFRHACRPGNVTMIGKKEVPAEVFGRITSLIPTVGAD